jgi:hypothetical protein
MVFQADVVSLLRTLLILVGVYYGIRFLFRVAFPWLLKWWLQRVVNKMQSQQGHQHHSNHSREKDPSVTISSDNHQRSDSSGKSGGEYIDFEEV